MELLNYYIPWPSRRERTPVVIAPIGDIQWAGQRGPTAKALLKEHIDKCMDLGAWFIGLGDYIDFLSPSNRQRMRAAALYDCVSEDTRILTRSGWKYHRELIIGEDVLGYDMSTRSAVWTPVRRVVVWDEAPVVNLRADGWSWRVTDNHRWVAQMQDGRQEILPTYALRQGRHKIVTSAACSEDGDSDISPDEAALLGWLITDGHVQFPECWTTYLAQSKPRYITEIRALVGRLPWLKVAETEHRYTGLAAATNQRGRWTRWGFSAPEIRGMFARAGASCDADLPRMASHLSVASRRTMLDAMLHAEGHQEKSGGWQFSQKPGPRLDVFLSLCALLGIPTRRGHLADDGVIRTGTRKSTLRWVQGAHWARSTETIIGHETVWCPVTDVHTWMACYDSQTSFTGNTAEDVIDDKAMDLVHELYQDYLKPTKGRWIGMVHGHHYAQLKTGETTDQRLCQLLDTTFLGTSAYIRLCFVYKKPKDGRPAQYFTVTLLVHHGHGGGQKVHAPIMKLENWAPYWDADVMLIGHMTKQAVAPIERIHPRWIGRSSPDLVHRRIYLVGCGGFSKGYVEGSKSGRVPMGGYVEQKLMNPVSLGAPLIRITPRFTYAQTEKMRARRPGGPMSPWWTHTWSPDIRVEL